MSTSPPTSPPSHALKPAPAPEPAHSLALPDWKFLPTARPTVYTDRSTLKLRLDTLDRKFQKLEKRHFFQRKDAVEAYLAALDATQDLVRRSRDVFTWREDGDLVPNVLLNTARTFRERWRAAVEHEAYRKPPKDAPLDPHLDAPSSDDENMDHFDYRARKLDLRLKHAHAKRNRLDVRHTIEARKLTEEEEAKLIKQTLIAAEEEPEDGIQNAPRANGGIGIVAGRFPRTDAYAMFSALALENTRLITVPRAPTHVTVATAVHLHQEAPMAADEFRVPNPLLGPRCLVRRHSMSYHESVRLSGGASRPGGAAVPRPDRLTMFVKSRLTGVRHLAFLPPLNGETLTASTSHEDRERLMLRQLRNAAARMIQRMWHHRTGILMLLQRIRRRKKLEAEKAAAFAAAIEDDKCEAWSMFSRPAWAPVGLAMERVEPEVVVIVTGKGKQEEEEDDENDDDEEYNGGDGMGDDQGEEAKYGHGKGEAKDEPDLLLHRGAPPLQHLYPPPTQPSRDEPFKTSFNVVKKYKHIAHTITLNPRHAMSRRKWRMLCQDIVQIVAGHSIGTKPDKLERRTRRKFAKKGHLGPEAFTRKRAARWLAKLYARYVLTPNFMSIGYNKRASEYWGLVNAKDFAVDTHYAPSDAIVRTLFQMCGKSSARAPETNENSVGQDEEEGGASALRTVPPPLPEPDDDANSGVMPFGDFARGLMRLCCLNTIDLVSFQVMVVNDDLNKLAAAAELVPDEKRSDEEDVREEEEDDNKNDNADGSGTAKTRVPSLGVTQRRLNRLLCRLHQGHDEYKVLLPEDHKAGPSGYSWAVDQEDMSGIVERSLIEMRAGRAAGDIMGPIDLLELLVRCPILVWPCIHMQRCLRRRVFGERFWRDFRMDRVRPALPARLTELTVRVAKQNYHNMALRHAWAATTQLIQFASLGVRLEDSLSADEEGGSTRSACVVPHCGQRLAAADLSNGLCKACSLKSVGIIAGSVGFRVAHRFRERSRWFDRLFYKEPLPVPVHTSWLLMRDPLTRSNFYFNGETAATRWRLGIMENRMASAEHPIKVVDMRPKQRKKKRKKGAAVEKGQRRGQKGTSRGE
jgi:hypothetical protein